MGTVRFILLILLFSYSQMAAAGLCKCKGPDGISYSQKPCASGSKPQQLRRMQSAPPANSNAFNKSGKTPKAEKPNQNIKKEITASDSSAPYIRKVFESEQQFVEYMFSRRPITDPEKLMASVVESFKLVLDDIYEEMGRPALTKEFSKKFDRKIFSRRDVQAPRFEPNVAMSWTAYSNRVDAIISCCASAGGLEEVQVIWHPNQPIEIVQN